MGAVSADPDLLQLALNNLLSNAVRYNEPKGRIMVTAETLRDGDGFQITVRDEGPGIPIADQARIFEAFYRADSVRSRRKDAHGLGLSLAQEAVQRMGGRIEVASEPGQGAAFTITL